MGLFRFLLLVALAWIAWKLLRRALQPPATGTPGDKRDDAALTLTRCERCGTYIPQTPGSSSTICERCRHS